MSDPITSTISAQLQILMSKISTFNKKGDLYGLFSYHIISDIPDLKVDWNVTCNDKNWLEKVFKKDNLYDISKLGYSIYLNKKGYSKAQKHFLDSIRTLKKRNHFNGTHVTFPYQPVTYLGLVLGTKITKSVKQRESYIDWLFIILKERKRRGSLSGFHEVFYKYIEAELNSKKNIISVKNDSLSLAELSFIYWGIRRNFFQFSESENAFENIRQNILKLLIETDINQIEPEEAALIFYAVNESISKGIDRILKPLDHLIYILSRFEVAMKRWRYDDESVRNQIQWPINNEREIQDIIWLMLKPYFEDLVDEESLPKLGHSFYKPDFAIPSSKTLLEVKYVRKKADFKTVEKEIMQDSVGYLTKTKDYDKLIVFIYDHSCSVQEHEDTKRELTKIRGIEDVIIVSRPSQLPS